MTINIDFLDTVREDLNLLQSEADSLKDSVDAPLDQTGLNTEKTNIENTITSIESEISDIDDEIDALDPEDPYYEIDLEILTDDKTRLQSEILTLESTLDSLSDLSNTLDDVQDLINLSGNSTLDVFGDVANGIDEITQGIQDKVKILDSKCNLPLPLSQIGVEDLKAIAEKFAAKQILTVALESAKQGIPSNVLSQATSVVDKFNSIRSEVQGKLDTLKGAASKAQSLKSDFSSLVNGELTPEGILSVAQKWGGNVPGLDGLLQTVTDGLNTIQNFDICSLIPNFKLNPLTGLISQEPNDPVSATEDPEAAKILIPTVEDSRLKDTLTLDIKYDITPVQVEERKQATLDENKAKFDKEWKREYDDLNALKTAAHESIWNETGKEHRDYLSLQRKSILLQKPMQKIIQDGQASTAEEVRYEIVLGRESAFLILSEAMIKCTELESVFKFNLTRRINEPGRSIAILLAEQSLDKKINSPYFQSIPPLPEFRFNGVNRGNRFANVLKKYSNELYDYYNYSDHYK